MRLKKITGQKLSGVLFILYLSAGVSFADALPLGPRRSRA